MMAIGLIISGAVSRLADFRWSGVRNRTLCLGSVGAMGCSELSLVRA